MTKRIKTLYGMLGLIFILSACQPTAATMFSTEITTKAAPTPTHEPRTPTATKVPEIDLDVDLLKGTLVTFLHPWSGETSQTLYLMTAEFNQSNEWGIQVVLEEPGSLGLAISKVEQSGVEEPSIDMLVLPAYELLRLDLESQPVLDLNPYLASKQFGITEAEQKDFYPLFWNHNLIDGKLYGIPAQETATILFYNQTWASELGFSQVPTNTLYFRNQACAANAVYRKDNDSLNDGLGGWLISKDASNWLNWLRAFQAVDSGAPIEQFSSSETEETFTYLFNLQKDACAWEGRQPEPYDYFATRQTLMYSGTLQDIAPQKAAFERSGSKDQWQVILYPSNSDSKLLVDDLSYGITATDPVKQLASWLFIRWLSSPDHQVRLLETMGSFPLGSTAQAQMAEYKSSYPQWGEAVSLRPFGDMLIPQPDATILRMVLADAGAFMLKPEFTADKIPNLLQELDATIAELEEQQP